MNYQVHITRKKQWPGLKGERISLNEWLAYIKQDPEMSLAADPNAGIKGYQYSPQDNEGLAVWVNYSGYKEQGTLVWFDYYKGDITVINPDSEILDKMSAIAQHFSAQVFGEDGKRYGANGEPVKGFEFGFRATRAGGKEVTDRVNAESVQAARKKLENMGYENITLLDNELTAVNVSVPGEARRLVFSAKQEEKMRRQKSFLSYTLTLLMHKNNVFIWGSLLLWITVLLVQYKGYNKALVLPFIFLGVYIFWFIWASIPAKMYNKALEASAWYQWTELEKWMLRLERWKKWFKIPMPDHEIQMRLAMVDTARGRLDLGLQRLLPFAQDAHLPAGYYHNQVGSLFYYAKNYPQMLFHRQESVRLNSSDTFKLDLAICYSRFLGEFQKAQEVLDGLDITTMVPLARMVFYYCSGLISLHKGDAQGALENMGSAMEYGQQFLSSPLVQGIILDMRAHYGLALVGLGRLEEAREHFAAARPILLAHDDQALLARLDKAENSPL